MNRKLDPEPQREIFTLRRSIFVWFCGGVIGWAAAILLIYTVFQGGEQSRIADTKPQSQSPAADVANGQNPDADSLSQIAPAAGPEAKSGDDAEAVKPDQPADASPAK
jgi:hypothetical protein